MPATHTLYELDVRLRHLAPPIWRTLELPGTATLEDLHYAIQLAMGWENAHLHQFVIGKKRYGMAGSDEFEALEDERAYALPDVLKAGAVCLYEYDFGDGWEHDVRVTRVAPAAKAVRPRCTGGERACPPEDCGGPPGYERMLAALADPNHPEHEEMTEWVPEGFTPEAWAPPAKDLTRAIAELRALAEEGREDRGGGEPELEAAATPPPQLVEAALALPPLQRANLAAMLAGSLADQLMTAIEMLGESMRAPRTAARGHSTAAPRRGRTRR